MLSAADLASIATTVAASLDQSLPLYRKTASTSDGYGTSVPTWTSEGNIACTVAKPSATNLTTYAELIGSQRALTIRALQTTDIREGDRVVYDSLNWLIQRVLNANSYSVTKQYLMTVVV